MRDFNARVEPRYSPSLENAIRAINAESIVWGDFNAHVDPSNVHYYSGISVIRPSRD